MANYEDILKLICAALTQRPAGTQVQVADHENAEIALLDYIEQVKNHSAQTVREAHGMSKGSDPSFLAWSQPFKDKDFSWVVNGYDIKGQPVVVYLIEANNEGLLVTTSNDATLYAIAMPFSPLPDNPINPEM